MNETLIEVKNVKKSFQIGGNENVIIDGLNLNIQKGDFSVIMGASGSGKSTILYMLSGMDKATAGYLKKNPKSEILERSKKLLVQVGLENEMYKKPSQVSGGQAQRAAIVRAQHFLVNKRGCTRMCKENLYC